MEYIGIPLAMLVMFLAERIEMRLGVAAAGWFAALPVSFAVATASIAAFNGHAVAANVAVSAIGHVGPMILYGVLFVVAVPRWGMIRGFLLSATGYALASVAIAPLPAVAAIALGAVALLLGNLFQARRAHAPLPRTAASRLQRTLSLLSAGFVVAVLTLSNDAFGPAIAGALGAFPVMSTTIAFANAPREGAANASTVMAGVARSLPIYLAYGLVFATVITRSSLLWAVCAALSAGVLTFWLVRRVVRPRAHGSANEHVPDPGVAAG